MKLPDELNEILNEEQKSKLESILTELVDINVKLEMQKREAVIKESIESILEKADECYAIKTRNLFEQIVSKHKSELDRYKSKHNKELVEEACSFKENFAKNVNQLISENIREMIGYETFRRAAKNDASNKILKALQEQLNVCVTKESVKSFESKYVQRVKEEHEKITESIKEMEKSNEELLLENNQLKRDNFLKEKTASMPETAVKHITNFFKDSDLQYVMENFDYVANLTKDNEISRREKLQQTSIREHKSLESPNKKSQQKTLSENLKPLNGRKQANTIVEDMYLDAISEMD